MALEREQWMLVEMLIALEQDQWVLAYI